MGNQLIKDTNIEKESLGMGGYTCQWEMHGGNKTNQSKTPVTVFLFDKKVVAKMSGSAKEEYLTAVKKEPQTLARFKHPNILGLIDPLLEDQRSMGFVTEAVKGSLLNFINANKVAEIFPTELDTKFHLLELAETLSFLHNDVKSCHLSISPENVYVLANEKWKLGGFTYTTQVVQAGLIDCPIDFQKPGDKVTPNLKFTAPEVANFSPKCTFASDIFSFGCLIYTIYKVNSDKNTNSPYLMNATSINGVQDFAKEITKQNFFCIPEQIRPIVIRMLHPDPKMRAQIGEFLNHSWFKDPFIQTVKHLEQLYQKDLPQQQSFLKGLSQIILKFEKKFVMSKILPLLNNLIKNEQLASSILPTYFKLIDNEGNSFLTKDEFHSLIWPSIKSLSSGKQMPAQALYLLVQHSHLLVDIGDIKEIQSVFVPLLIKSFECNVQKLQVLALQKTEALFSKIEYNVSKSQILPRVLHLCLDNNIDLRKEALMLLSKIYSVFDRTVINDQILTTLEKVRRLSNNYKINMTILSIFEGISKNIGVDVIANKILISLIPMLVDPNLSKPEYKAYLSTVKAYLKRIEDEQNTRYEGMSDLPPAEAQDEMGEKNPVRSNAQPITGEFEFLNAINGGAAESQSSAAAEFDFTGFEEQFSGFGKSSSMNLGSSTPGTSASESGWSNQGMSGLDDFSTPVTNPKPSNPMVIKSQSQNVSSNPSVPGKNIKSLGNPFTNQQNQSQPQTKQNTPAPYNFGVQNNQANKPATSTTSQQGQNAFGGMKINKPANQNTGFPSSNMNQAGGQNKWDILDSEIQTNDFGSGLGGMGGMGGMSNQPSNQFQYNAGNSGSNFQNAPASSGMSGWGDVDLDIGGLGGLGSNPSFGASNPQQNFNQNMGGMQNQGGFNQNQGGFNQNQNQNKFGQAKPTFPQKTTPTTFQNTAKNPINSSDDFFSAFDIKETGQKKNAPFSFAQKQQSGHDDLI